MKNFARIARFMAVFLTAVNLLTGQNSFKKDIIEVSKNMFSLKVYSVTLKYFMYVDNEPAVFQTRSVQLRKDNSKLRIEQDRDGEMIENGDEQVNIDHKRKKIYYLNMETEPGTATPKNKKELTGVFEDFSENFDSLNKYIEKVNLLTDKGGIKEYEIVYREGAYTRLIMKLDMGTKTYRSLKAWYRDKDQIEVNGITKPRSVCMRVEYDNMSSTPTFTKNTFSITRYINRDTKGNILLDPDFKNYKLTIL